jgi:acylglycerol lipase
MNEDPLIAHETQPTRTMAVLVRADERLNKEFSLITLPVLMLHGTLDENTKPSGSQHFYDSVGSVDKTLKLYEGNFHDLLNDTDNRAIMQDIQDWINARLPTALAKPACLVGREEERNCYPSYFSFSLYEVLLPPPASCSRIPASISARMSNRAVS